MAQLSKVEMFSVDRFIFDGILQTGSKRGFDLKFETPELIHVSWTALHDLSDALLAKFMSFLKLHNFDYKHPLLSRCSHGLFLVENEVVIVPQVGIHDF